MTRERFPGVRPGVSDERGNMSKATEIRGTRFTRGVLGVTLAVGLAATAVAAIPDNSTAAPEIAPVDSASVNVLEPGDTGRVAPPTAPPSADAERQLRNWFPTGNKGGTGAKGSPKG